MMDERMTAKGLGHQVSWIVSGRDALKVDILALNCIANEVKLDAEVAGPERSLCRCRDLQAGLIILADEGGSSGGMTKFGQQLAQIKRLSSGETKSHIFCLSC